MRAAERSGGRAKLYTPRMVRLTKIYTKMGDGGQTMLGDGKMVAKHSTRVESYGTVDEANAAIGLAIVALGREPGGAQQPIATELIRIQNDLFDLGADLCVPIEAGEQPGKKLRATLEQATRLEGLIDSFNAGLAPLESFVLPGGSEAAAHLHLARTITRRAERCVALLLSAEPQATNPNALIYLNRLSDLLFVLARVANDRAGGDVLWKPGANR